MKIRYLTKKERSEAIKKGRQRHYDLEELFEILIVIICWKYRLNQEQIREILHIDMNRISRTAQKLEKFKKKKYGTKNLR